MEQQRHDRKLRGINAVLTVVLAGTAIFVAWQANDVANTQAELMRLEHLPRFQLQYEDVPDPNNGSLQRERLRINNIGAPVTQFVAQPMYLLMIWEWTGETTERVLASQHNVPLYAYFGPDDQFFDTLTNNMQGELVSWYGPQSITEGEDEADRLIGDFIDIAEQNGYIVEVGGVALVDVQYTDAFGDRHREVHQVGPGLSSRIEDNSGMDNMDRYVANLGSGEYPEVGVSTGEDLYGAWFRLRSGG